MPKANFFGENGNGFFMNVDMPKLTKNRVLVKVIYKILVLKGSTEYIGIQFDVWVIDIVIFRRFFFNDCFFYKIFIIILFYQYKKYRK